MQIKLTVLLIATALAAGTTLSLDASARPVRHHVKVEKTHRILAGSKSIRINNVGEVITNEHP